MAGPKINAPRAVNVQHQGRVTWAQKEVWWALGAVTFPWWSADAVRALLGQGEPQQLAEKYCGSVDFVIEVSRLETQEKCEEWDERRWLAARDGFLLIAVALSRLESTARGCGLLDACMDYRDSFYKGLQQ